jgi:hypothetical protein
MSGIQLLDPNMYTNTTRSSLGQIGSKRVTGIVLYRQLVGGLNVIQQIITDIQKYGFDKVYHTFSVLTMEDGSQWMLEKNANINLTPYNGTRGSGSESVNVQISSPKTLNEMLKNTETRMGQTSYFQYDAFRNNCQDWLMNFLQSNNLATNQTTEFLKQDISKMVNESSQIGTIAPIVNELTDLGHLIGQGRTRSTPSHSKRSCR